MKKQFDLNDNYGFKIHKTETDALGLTHIRLQQTYQGIPVELAEWILHINKAEIKSMNGLIFNNLELSATPTLTQEQALDFAKKHIGATAYKWEIPEEEAHYKWESGDESNTYYPTGELVYIPKKYTIKAENYRLAYKFDIYSHEPLSRSYVFVDAITGEILAEDSIIHHVDTPGTAVTAYSGPQPIIADSFAGQFRLRDGSRGLGVRTFDLNNAYGYGGAVDFIDADNIWNNINPQFDEYAGDAHWGTEVTYDYFNDMHGRNSIDGAGFALNSYVHYGTNYVNAFWDGTRMTYGDGNGGAPYTPLTSLDIAGHEITHGLTNFTAGLIYYGESGALNESFSDIFGTAIENFARPGDWDWLLSADIGGVFRSLENPNAFGDPDTYFGVNWASLVGPDNGGVHTNSGVQNHWYYLLVEGGVDVNDNGDAFDVTGIGFESASAIAFRNLTVYLTPGSDHADARFFAIQSAIDLFGPCSVEEEETTNAWYAVGVGDEYITQVTADFTTTVGCFPMGEVDFTDASIAGVGVLDTWSWNFGDGGTSFAMSPSHTYAATGTYPVELTVTNDLGCENRVTIDVTVVDAPEADFSFTDLCEGLPTNFTDESTIIAGAIDTWEWDFGDAATSPLADPAHVYAAFGPYDVKLIVTSDNGCQDSVTLPVEIAGTPIVDFSFADVCFGETSEFTNLSTAPDGEVLTDFTWDFGDGTPTVATESPTHDYAAPGTYTVTLDVVSPTTCNNTISYEININQIPDALFEVADVCLGEDALFNDLSTVLAPDIMETLEWNFGDGSTEEGADPTHIFAGGGTYTVTLVATTDKGCSDEITLPITIHPNPVANFSATEVCINGNSTNFTDMSTISSGIIDTWIWAFGDGFGSGVPDPIKKYSSAGTYDVELTVISEFGCYDNVTIPVLIKEKPNANFTSDLTSICSPNCIQFTSLSAAPGAILTDWHWKIENGSESYNENPNICFDAVTTDQLYDVSLIVTNNIGCKDTINIADYLNIIATPLADFSYTPAEIDILDPSVNFTNLSEYGSSFSWDFGDNTVLSDATNPNHTYADQPAEYEVTLEVTSENGLCTSVASKIVSIKDVIIYYIPNTFTPGGDLFNDTFKPVFYSGYDPYDFHLMIYNRWGEIVFETYNAAYGWDGTYGNEGLVETGVFVWSLEFQDSQSDKKHQDYGHVTVIK